MTNNMMLNITMRYHFIHTACLIIKMKANGDSENVEPLESYFFTGENVKWCSHSGKHFDCFLRS